MGERKVGDIFKLRTEKHIGQIYMLQRPAKARLVKADFAGEPA